jgi:hypothetical protein
VTFGQWQIDFEMRREQEAARERAAAAKWLGPDAAAGRLYDIVELMRSLITCHDVDVLQGAMRVCRHALGPIQKDLEAERLQKYYEEAYRAPKEAF